MKKNSFIKCEMNNINGDICAEIKEETDNKATKKYYCKHCEYKAKNKKNLHQHVKSTHEGITYVCLQCELCEYKTKKEDKLALSTLQYHVKTVHKRVQ